MAAPRLRAAARAADRTARVAPERAAQQVVAAAWALAPEQQLLRAAVLAADRTAREAELRSCLP